MASTTEVKNNPIILLDDDSIHLVNFIEEKHEGDLFRPAHWVVRAFGYDGEYNLEVIPATRKAFAVSPGGF